MGIEFSNASASAPFIASGQHVSVPDLNKENSCVPVNGHEPPAITHIETAPLTAGTETEIMSNIAQNRSIERMCVMIIYVST